MPTNSFTILGSSSGLPQANRATAGYALEIDGRLSLLDCGGGVCSSFLRCGFDPLDIDRIFVSHTHSDHVCELPLVIQMVYLAGQKDRFDIYVPAEFVGPLKTYLTAVYLIQEKLPFAVNITGYENGFSYCNQFKLTALGNRHLQGYTELIRELELSNKMQCYSFQIEVGDKSLFYSADLFNFDDVKKHLEGKDYVILESTHIDLNEFFEFARTSNVGRYVLTHLGTEDEVAEIMQRAKKVGLNNLVTAVDGMELAL